MVPLAVAADWFLVPFRALAHGMGARALSTARLFLQSSSRWLSWQHFWHLAGLLGAALMCTTPTLVLIRSEWMGCVEVITRYDMRKRGGKASDEMSVIDLTSDLSACLVTPAG